MTTSRRSHDLIEDAFRNVLHWVVLGIVVMVFVATLTGVFAGSTAKEAITSPESQAALRLVDRIWTVEHFVPLAISLIVGICGAIPGIVAVFRIRELHIIVNSRLTQLLKLTEASSHAEGVLQGKEEQKTEDAP